MSWSVRLQGEDGKPAEAEDIELPFQLLDQLATDWVMLQGINRYADTTFNGTQARFLLSEWDALAVRIRTPEDRITWKAIRDYVERCAQNPHLYLKFIGD